MLRIYVCLYWLLELVVFYSLVRRGYIRKVSVQLVPKYFSRDCSTDSISCSERKKLEEKILKQDIKSGKEDQNVVFIANSPISSSNLCRCCCSVVAPLLHRYRSAVTPLLLRYCTAIAPLLLRCRTTIDKLSICCRSAVVPLSHCYRSAVAPLLSICCCADVAPLLYRYFSTVSPMLSLLMSLRSRTAIVPLLLRCCCSCCRYAVAPLSLRFRTVVEPLSLRTRENINNSKLNCCCSTVTPLSLLLSIGRFTRLSLQ